MATMHSRCYFSTSIYGNDAVTIMVSFGGPIVKHPCAMNTQCMQNSCQSRNGTLTIITDIVADKGGYIHILLEWTQVTYSGIFMYYRMGSILAV